MRATTGGLGKLFALLALCWLGAPELSGLVVFDTTTSGDNARNVIEPGDAGTHPGGAAAGVPWRHVVRYGVNNASGVYLGHGCVLTARHVTVNDGNLLINGVSYARDTTFAPIPVTIPGDPDDEVVDLSLQKIVGDPGLAPLPIAGPAANDTSQAVVMVGWGKGKGAIVANQGWNWGDNTTFAFRWGTNVTNSSPTLISSYSLGGQQVHYDAITTLFNSTQGGNEAAGAVGDSGGPLFQKIAGTWTLTGTTVTVSVFGRSFYSPSDATFFVRLREYSWVLRYDHWKARHNLPPATPDDDDSDGDGVPLLMEYALGMDPTVASTDGLPVATIEGGSLALTYSRLATTTDIKVEIETSTTFAPGSWAVEPATTTTLSSTSVFRTVKSTVPLDPGTPKFARIKVTKL